MMIVAGIMVEASVAVSVYELVPVLLVVFGSRGHQRGCESLVVCTMMSGVGLVGEFDGS